MTEPLNITKTGSHLEGQTKDNIIENAHKYEYPRAFFVNYVSSTAHGYTSS